METYKVTQPEKSKYRPGEKISYKGARFELAGQDVTEQVSYSIPEGTIWEKGTRVLEVDTTLDGEEIETIRLTCKRNWIAPVLAVLLVAAIGTSAGVFAWQTGNPPSGDIGSYVIPQGDMTDSEARALLDEMAEKSRIAVSVAPKMLLADDGTLRVNFVVAKPNNGFSERLEIEQDETVVYRSGIVEPGYKIEWGTAQNAHAGEAIATVYAVSNGTETGNPVSVEVEIADEA